MTASSALPHAGVELGGTKCIVTLAHGPDAVIAQESFPTIHPDETLPRIAALLDSWRDSHGFRALGIASFGPICLDPADPRHGRILATTKPDWPNADVRGVLSAGRSIPVGFDTDVNGAALAEMRWGCARGIEDFAYVTVGTGVGVGLIVHGRPTRGIAHSEIGHVRVPRLVGDDFDSVCRFHPDCVEGLASGSALVARLRGRPVEDVGADDPVWEPIVATLAAMAHGLVTTTGPRFIAIGGGMPTRQPHLVARIDAALRESLNGYMALPDGPIVVAPALGAMAGPLGSIALAMAAEADADSAATTTVAA